MEEIEDKTQEGHDRRARTGSLTLTIGITVNLFNYFKEQDLESRAIKR